MQLKLAEYNLETGKFERFLELEKPIQIDGEERSAIFNSRESSGFLLAHEAVIVPNLETNQVDLLKKDEKDPLNRFDGLFNGRTYGGGKFVLIEDNQDNVYQQFLLKNPITIGTSKYPITQHFDERLAGNIHENPELYNKVYTTNSMFYFSIKMNYGRR